MIGHTPDVRYQPDYEDMKAASSPAKPGKPVSANGIRAAVAGVRNALDEAENQLGEMIMQLDPISTGGVFYSNKFDGDSQPAPEPPPTNPIVEQLNEITARIEHVSRRLRAATNLLNEQL